MSAQFYRRFVPSNGQPVKQSHVPAKSLELSSERHISPVERIDDTVASSADEHGSERRETKVLPRREKKKRKRADSPEDDADGTDGFQKHRRLKQKYDKAPIKAGNEIDESRVQQKPDAPADSEDPKLTKKHGLEPLPQPSAADEAPVIERLPVPPWMEDAITVPKTPSEPIESLPVSDRILENLKKRGLKQAMPIQETVIPLFFPKKGSRHRNRGDVCVSAPTGSGKTLSYAIPMIEALKGMPTRHLRGLVIVPTRELVHQVKETLDLCADGSDLKIGTSLKNRTLAQERELLLERRVKYDPEGWEERERKAFRPTIEDLLDERDSDSEGEYDVPPGYIAAPVSAVDILVCTPGRLVDHIRSTAGFTLHQVSWLVIDEADKLLDQTFQQWASVVKRELEWMPEQPEKVKVLRHFLHYPQERRVQKVVLSASMTHDIGKLLAIGLWRPRLVEAQKKDYELPAGLSEVAVTLGPDSNKLLILSVLLEEILNDKQTFRPQKQVLITSNDVKDGDGGDKDGHSGSGSSSASESDSGSQSESDSDSDSSSASDSDSSDGTTSSSNSGAAAEPGPAQAKVGPQASRLQGILIFANSNEEVLRLGRFLSLLKPQLAKRLAVLSQATKSADMKHILGSFRSGKLSIVVATDRAARGLDVENLKAVVNYDIPTSLTDYVHRAGRTARVGREGTVYSIVQHHEGRWFWNEIGKSDQVERPAKVVRRKDMEKAVNDEAKAAYEKAHDSLGDEVKGTM